MTEEINGCGCCGTRVCRNRPKDSVQAVRAMIADGTIVATPAIRRALARGDIDGVMNEHGRLSRLGWGTLQRRAPMRHEVTMERQDPAEGVRAMIADGTIVATPAIRRALARGDIETVFVEHGRALAAEITAARAYRRRKSDSSEPRVRMDIQTAVQIASLSDQPLGLVELLTGTAPVHLGEFVGPAEGVFDAVVVDVVDTTRRWRDALARRAREASRLDKDIARSAAFLARMARDRRITNMLAWVCAAVASALVVALNAWLMTRQ